MGFLTTVTLHNDAMHQFKKHRLQFCKALFDGIDRADANHKAEDIGFRNYGGYLTAQHSRHADDHTIYVHSGNCVVNMNPWEEETKALAKRNPKFFKKLVDELAFTVKELKRLQKQG